MKNLIKNFYLVKHLILIIFFIPLFAGFLYAQSSDDLFLMARDAAFKHKNFSAARELCKQALAKSPHYKDISLFLGRLYTWDKMYDSARTVLYDVIEKDTSLDAYSAVVDVEFWSGNINKALEISNRSLLFFPKSEELLLKNAKIQTALENYNEAEISLNRLMEINNKNEEAMLFSDKLHELMRINTVTVTYDHDIYNKTFTSWNAASLAYSRQTVIGSVTGRINYANRFDINGLQYELEAYPHFTTGFYAYLNAGYSNSAIFPNYRLGVSLYYTLPYSFEVDAGIRYLDFSSSNVKIYTAALGKYYSNFWFSFRTFITPSIDIASKSFSLITRYYLTDADNYFTLTLGSGISPDERAYGSGGLLVSKRAGLEYQDKLNRSLIAAVNLSFSRDEYDAGQFRNRYTLGLVFKTLF